MRVDKILPHDPRCASVQPALVRATHAAAAVALLLGLASVAACGGIAVVDPEGPGVGGQGGTAGATTTTSTTSTTTTTHTGGHGGSGGTYVPPIDSLEEVDIGPVSPGETATYEVEPPILGMTVAAQIPSEFMEISIDQIRAPNGTYLVQNAMIPTTSAWFLGYGIAAAAVPQTDHTEAMPVMGGTWEFAAETDYSGGPVDLTIWQRQTVDGEFHGGVIDVNVFRVPSVSSQNYMTNLVHQALDPWYGLNLGQINHFTLPGSYYTVDEYDVLDLFQETSAAERRPSLNVLVVGAFTGQLEGAGGFTMGAPGYPLKHGNILSGVVMLVYGYEDLDALVLRHESGHLAGLFHTTEIEGGLGDYLDDTPFCPDVLGMMESCPDFDNLMFPIGGSPAMQLSPKQQKVIQGSTLYRGIVQEGDPPVPPLDEGGASAGSGAAADVGDDVGASAAWPGATPEPHYVGPAAEQEWAGGLSPALASQLYGVWEVGYGPSPIETARQLAFDDAELLWSIGADHRAPAHVRMRALMTLGRVGPDARLRRHLARLAVTRAAHPRVRIGALRALAAAGAAELGEVRARLRLDPDPLVARVAARM